MALIQVFRGKKRGLGIFGTHLYIFIMQILPTEGLYRGLCIHHWCNRCCKYNEKSLCLWWCHTWQCWVCGSEIMEPHYSNCLPCWCSSAEKPRGGMCRGTAGGAWVHGCRSWHHHMVLETRDYFNVTQLGVTFSCLVLGVGARAPSQSPETKPEAINRRSTNLACQGISHVLWDRHRLSLQISSERLKTRWKKNNL